MRELIGQDGQSSGWHIMTAFEAKIIGQAAVFNDPDKPTTLYLHHAGTEGVTSSEADFAAREAKFGRLTVGRWRAERAEEAFRQIVNGGEPWNGIEPNVAQHFVVLIDSGLQASKVLKAPDPSNATEAQQATVVEVPDLSDQIAAEGPIQQAA